MTLTEVPVVDGYLAGRTLTMYGARAGATIDVLLPPEEAVWVDDELCQVRETYMAWERDGHLELRLYRVA